MPLVLDALANDLNARQPGFAPVVVSGPAHGSVAVGAGGSFTYTPETDWFGEENRAWPLLRRYLEAHGCSAVQGYLFSRPKPAAEFERFRFELAATT